MRRDCTQKRCLARFEILIVLILRVQVFWDMLFHWMSGSECFEHAGGLLLENIDNHSLSSTGSYPSRSESSGPHCFCI